MGKKELLWLGAFAVGGYLVYRIFFKGQALASGLNPIANAGDKAVIDSRTKASVGVADLTRRQSSLAV